MLSSTQIAQLWSMKLSFRGLSKKKKKKKLFFRRLGPVWYVCLKTKNYCLKIFVKIRVGKKMPWNTWNVD